MRRISFLCMLGACALIPNAARPTLTIDITKGVVSKIPLVFPRFEGGEDVAGIVANDLDLSGVFEILHPKGHPSSSSQAWQFKEGAVWASGAVLQEGDELILTVRLQDVGMQQLLARGEIQVRGKADQRRVFAHKVSNAIYERLTGEKGYFDTRIVYTAQWDTGAHHTSSFQGMRHAPAKIRRIAIMDCDGENAEILTPELTMALTPQCSLTQPLIAFLSIEGLKNKVRIMDLRTRRSFVIPKGGIHVSPRFSPDGTSLVYCVAKEGTTSIHLYEIATSKSRQLTEAQGRIDVSPTFSPDGNTIIFSSDRKGRPQLYSLTKGDAVPRLLTVKEGSYLSPVWSPDGKWIAFIKRKEGKHYLGLMDPRGGQERLIAKDHVIDYPSWAPNSRAIVFGAQQHPFGKFELYVVDFSGRTLRPLKTHQGGRPHEGNHPSWQYFQGGTK